MIRVTNDHGHEFVLLTSAYETAPAGYACTLYPLDDDESVEAGDSMTCLVCGETAVITGKD